MKSKIEFDCTPSKELIDYKAILTQIHSEVHTMMGIPFNGEKYEATEKDVRKMFDKLLHSLKIDK